jgi:hypothetical protein
MGVMEDKVTSLVTSLAFSPTMMESHPMRHKFHDEHFSDTWRSAEHRRAEDIYFWFTRFFARQPRLELPGPGLQHLGRRSAVIIYRLLKIPHAVSRTTKSAQ